MPMADSKSISEIMATLNIRDVVIDALKRAKRDNNGLTRRGILKQGFSIREEDMTGTFDQWSKNIEPNPSNTYSKVSRELGILIKEGKVRAVKIGRPTYYFWAE
jgi:hypothetical protein